MSGRSVTVAVRTRPTATFAQDQVILDLDKHVRLGVLAVMLVLLVPVPAFRGCDVTVTCRQSL